MVLRKPLIQILYAASWEIMCDTYGKLLKLNTL